MDIVIGAIVVVVVIVAVCVATYIEWKQHLVDIDKTEADLRCANDKIGDLEVECKALSVGNEHYARLFNEVNAKYQSLVQTLEDLRTKYPTPTN